MTWAMKRRLIILAVIAFVIGVTSLGTAFLLVHKAPTCVDGKQNQGEEGPDCGGPCPYLCTISQAQPSVRFVRPLSPLPGRTDVIAYIDNPNPTSATKGARFTTELYDDKNVVIAKSDGVVDLSPGATVPVFIPNFFSGSQTVARAFLTFDQTSFRWFKAEPVPVTVVAKDVFVSQADPPRVTARLANLSATNLRNIGLIVTVFDENGNAIASSQTVAPEIAGQGTAEAVFTWPSAFPGTPSRIEVVPVTTLLP